MAVKVSILSKENHTRKREERLPPVFGGLFVGAGAGRSEIATVGEILVRPRVFLRASSPCKFRRVLAVVTVLAPGRVLA